ncbi:hypothetical protein [Microcoleus sp. bin38.metabat.b11b12b14.051]|uniref:tetratricopeptide repeat protein n=1 Tax=Microcoleus sp. bin38.metabat.b11b12b14.051 TaxID=2742709 RepID=UPI0025E5667B|nr:hypothetical protein [Microcoleus sp. bin38.metabat.b11b12b14.051]
MKQTSDKLEFVEMFAFWMPLFVGGVFFVTGLFVGSSSGNFWVYLFAPLGLIIMILAEIETITLDKNLGHMTIKRHQPLITKKKIIKHLLQDISGVEIQGTSSSEGNTYRVCLVLDSGKRRVPLTSSFSTGLGDKDKKAEIIATFLNIRNYGLDGFPTDNSNELKWDSIEEEITHWKTAIKSDSNDADAHMKLGLALMLQDATNNKEEAMGYLKEAQTLFKAQGYDEEATQALQLYSVAYWGMMGK